MDTKILTALLAEMVTKRSDHIMIEQTMLGGTVRTIATYGYAFPMENGGICSFRFKDLPWEDLNHFCRHGFLPRQSVNVYLLQIGFGEKYLPCEFDQIRHKDRIDACITQLLERGRLGLVLSGGLGTGKTTAMRYIAEQLLTKSQCRIMSNHLMAIRTSRLYSLIMDRERKEDICKIEQSPYLFIDDFGRTYEVEFANNKFEDLLAYRYDNRLPTFITTNMDLRNPEIKNHPIWGRIVDLFRDREWMYDAFIIGGESMRGIDHDGK